MVFWDLVLANISTLYYLVQAFNRRENKIGIRALLFRKEMETAAATVCSAKMKIAEAIKKVSSRY